ncbi:hypothetical protein SCA6_006641 [Theobroma cacao]
MVYKAGCKPNLTTFNVRIQYLVDRRRAWQANDLMPKMGIVPDEVAYNLVTKGFCRARSISQINVKIYQTMIHHLCKGREYNFPHTMCKDCMRKKWLLRSLLEVLIKNGQLGRDKIITLVRSRVPPFSSTQFDC